MIDKFELINGKYFIKVCQKLINQIFNKLFRRNL